jgi:hypothetical protein
MRRGEGSAMPIVARQPGARPPGVERSGVEASIGGVAPSEDLLPSGGASHPAPVPAPHRAPALDALRILRSLRDHPRDAGPWGESAFAREVDRVRCHLVPIRSRRGLAASFGREAFQVLDRDGWDQRGHDPVRIAYAVRWLELGDGVPRPGWTSLVTDLG